MSSRPLRIGITCFPTFGGSGLIATEIGLAMSARGHRVHVIARDLPVRLAERRGEITFDEVTESTYPVLAESSAYSIALASKMIEVSQREKLDLLHVHYAVPHATAAWMACEVMGKQAPKIITTLHGTDITLVGMDPNHLPLTRHSILRSHAVTVPSEFLRDATWENLKIERSFPIHVIPNFVDTQLYQPTQNRAPLSELFPSLGPQEPVLIHVSNFRRVKRLADVLSVFEKVHARKPCRLVMIGEGPEREPMEQSLKKSGLQNRVAFLGARAQFVDILAACDVFLLPSEQESFGLAALEALACGVPVVATNIGGLPELVTEGQTGFLLPVGDTEAMAAQTLSLLQDRSKWNAFSQRARERVLQHFTVGPAINRYEALYRQVKG